MSFLSFLNPIGTRTRRPLRACCLALYLITCAGFIIPLPVAGKAGSQDDSEPYPCQHHNCGCSSAKQCWENCCCMTTAQRLAWARDNGVQAPAGLTAKAEEKPKSCCGSSCCHQEPEPAVESHDADHEQSKCCGSTCSASGRSHLANGQTKSKTPVRWVSFIEAQKCNGGSVDWMAAGVSIAPAFPVHVEQDSTVQWLCVAPAVDPSRPLSLPEVPPPRSALV